MSDYLAVINILGGSSHGRSADKEEAIKRALFFFRDWEDVYNIPKQGLQIAVWDVDGYEHCVWGPDGMHGNKGAGTEFEKIDRVPEIVTREYTPRRKRKRA